MSEHNGSKYAPRPGFIPGVAVNLSGVTLWLAPLTLDQVKHFDENGSLKTLGALADDGERSMVDAIEVQLPFILASAQQNYPDLTVDNLRVLMNLGNLAAAVRAVMGQSGLALETPGEIRPASQ